MDLQKLRPTKSLFQAPRLTTAEAHQRIRAPPAPGAPKLVVAPEGAGGELWWKFYHDALLHKHPEPEKMADTALRAREKALALAAARPAVKQTLAPPKPTETAVANKGTAKVRPVLLDASRCKAHTLEGRRCGFKAVCGDFCKKHALKSS